MDALPKFVHGQQARMKGGELVTLTEKSRQLESKVRVINSKDKIALMNISDIDYLLPAPEIRKPRKDLCDQIDMPFYKGIRPTEKLGKRRE